MNHRDLFLLFLQRYAAKDTDAIAGMLSPDATLRDWHIDVHSREAVIRETQKNFDAARTIAIEVLHLHVGPQSVAGELRIVVDGDIELHVVDVIAFDAQDQVCAIRAYRGRGPEPGDA